MSFETAIRVDGLGKRYRLGLTHAGSIRELTAILGERARSAFRRVISGDGKNGHTQPQTAKDEQDFWALKNVDLEVRRGEVMGVIGRNGAGKSTLLKILSQITKPTTGRAEIHGRVGSLLEVGTGFHPELTGRENVFLNGAVLGMTRTEVKAKFDEIVEFSGVGQFIDTPVKRYSSGMKVRLGFAVAAHLEPEILIIDEVLAVGDWSFQKRCLAQMSNIVQGGRTIVFVSHDMSAICRLCHRVAWLDEGQVRSVGPPKEITTEYLEVGLPEESTAIELDSIERSGDYGQRVRLQEIIFNDRDPILHGEELRIRLRFTADSPLEGIGFAVTFRGNDGTRLLMVRSDTTDSDWQIENQGDGWVSFTCDAFPLTPSDYLIEAAAISRGRTSIDHIPEAGRIRVRPGPHTKPAHYAKGMAGLTVLEGDWQFDSPEDSPGDRSEDRPLHDSMVS